MMYTILPQLYREVLTRLCDAIDGTNYFCGTIAFRFTGETPDTEIDCRMTTSVIVYRSRESRPEGDDDVISDLIPVWWEFHTSTADGELINDFSFSELRRIL